MYRPRVIPPLKSSEGSFDWQGFVGISVFVELELSINSARTPYWVGTQQNWTEWKVVLHDTTIKLDTTPNSLSLSLSLQLKQLKSNKIERPLNISQGSPIYTEFFLQ